MSTVKVETSTIPETGNGLFALKDFKKGDIIGEYYGMVFGENEDVPKEHEYYIYQKRTGDCIAPASSCLCKYINDAVDLEVCINATIDELIWLGDFEKKTIRRVAREVLSSNVTVMDEEQCIFCEYNVEWLEKNNKVYVIAGRDIDEGEEFFIDYGWGYWIDAVIKGIKRKTWMMEKDEKSGIIIW